MSRPSNRRRFSYIIIQFLRGFFLCQRKVVSFGGLQSMFVASKPILYMYSWYVGKWFKDVWAFILCAKLKTTNGSFPEKLFVLFVWILTLTKSLDSTAALPIQSVSLAITDVKGYFVHSYLKWLGLAFSRPLHNAVGVLRMLDLLVL